MASIRGAIADCETRPERMDSATAQERAFPIPGRSGYPSSGMGDEFYEALGEGFAEDVIWTEKVRPRLVAADVQENVINICSYGFTEILNNANDHSGAEVVRVEVVCGDMITINIFDRGAGIFNHIVSKLNLDDVRHAVFELTKGKLTTDPDRHTGEGIFFTSRMFDTFSILSGSVFLGRSSDRDWLLTRKPKSEGDVGTLVELSISKNSSRTAKEIFDRYSSDQEDYGFRKTTVHVALSDDGKTMISRSQAKRVLSRLDRFEEVAMDFGGIDSITPAFADEIFRVFKRTHPKVEIHPVNANPDVLKMIRRAQVEATLEPR